jgi:hypothetical protein
MVSEDCTDTGIIIHGGAGNFYRVAIVAAPPTEMGDTPASVEDIRDSWEKIMNIEDAKERRAASATPTLVRPPKS